MGLESTIAAISPGWALKRAQARAALRRSHSSSRRFEGADRGRRTKGWITVGGSPNAEARTALHVLRDRCRDLKRNNPWGTSAVRILVSNIVGTGITPRFVGTSASQESAAADLWREWSRDPAQIDADGRCDFAGLQTAAVEEMVEAGEGLMRRRRRRASAERAVPLQIQLLEPDHIDTARDGEVDNKTGRRTVLGVTFSGTSERLGYWLFPEHPGSIGFIRRVVSEEVAASEIRHLYRLDRVGQVRGIPWGAPAVIRIHGLDNYEDSEAMRNVVATSYAGFVRDIDGGAALGALGPGGALPDVNALEQEIDEIESGTIQYLDPGKDITFTTPPQNETFPEYVRVQLRSIAKAYGVTYEQLAGDLSNVNFSSARMGWIDFQADVERWRRNIVIPHFCEPTLRWFIQTASAAGLLAPEGLRWEWTPPKRTMVDPRTDVNMEIAMVRAGMKSLSAAVGSMGFDLRQVLEELAKDLELAKSLGLVLQTDGSMTQGNGQDNVNKNGGGGSRDLVDMVAGRLEKELGNPSANGTISLQ